MKNNAVKGIYLALFLLLLGGAAGLRAPLSRRAREILPRDSAPLLDAPPMAAFTTVALGGLRGIVADILWIRAARLQMDGRYFELVQIADWITRLEPQISEVWAFNAWNLAYNIGLFFPRPEDRWRWVQNALSLLRDGGLRYNPDSPELYFEIGWLFQHKMGSNIDPAHAYYQASWSNEMTGLFSGPRPDYANPPASERLAAYRLDPALMRKTEDVYGPLDWRTVPAHALYWAHQGLETAQKAPDRLRLHRMIYQSLGDAFLGGNPDAPNFELLPPLLAAYQRAYAEFPTHPALRDAYRNFLLAAAQIARRNNRPADAELLDAARRRDFPASPQ